MNFSNIYFLASDSQQFVWLLKSKCRVQSHQRTFQTISPQWLQSLTLHLCSHVRSRARLCRCPADVCDSACLCFAGSQQSQDQTSRRSGNTGEKHNENGVRLKNICNTAVTWQNSNLTLPIKRPNILILSVKQTSVRAWLSFLCLQNKSSTATQVKILFRLIYDICKNVLRGVGLV